MRKIKQKELKEIRASLVKEQKGKCPISNMPLTLTNGVCDHDHDTGVIRAVLRRGVNGIEGKVANLLTRWGGCTTVDQRIKFLRSLADYWEYHKRPRTEWIYPTHKTPEEVREARLKKQRKAYAKRKAAMKK